MKKYVALLRGINVGGNTILPMSELRSICEDIGFQNVRTYIQSGNILFESEHSEEKLVKELEEALYQEKERNIPVIMRAAADLDSVIAHNPFPDANPSQVGVTFYSDPVPKGTLEEITTPGREEVKINGRELYVHYPDGIGRSKLKLPKQAQGGTMRNINTINKLAALSKEK